MPVALKEPEGSPGGSDQICLAGREIRAGMPERALESFLELLGTEAFKDF